MGNYTAVIITLNEQRHIAKCLQSLQGVADEIIVLDSHSTDDTASIAVKYGAKVVPTDWKGYGPTKNIGAELASHPWILSIDADEVLDEELRQSLQQFSPEQGKVYCWLRKSFIGNTWIRYSGWYPDKVYRLYHRDDTKWNDVKVHEGLIKQKLNTSSLKGYMLHYSFDTLDDHLLTQKKYGRLRAEDWLEQSKKPNIIKKMLAPTFRFINTYIIKRGFLDGRLGFGIALNESRMIRERYSHYDKMVNQHT